MTPEIAIYPDRSAAQAAAAERFAASARSAVQARGRFLVALSGGSTPRATYERLRDAALPWERIEIFFGDERGVPPDHPDSNYGMVRAALLDHVPVPPAQIHRMPADEPDADAAGAKYARVLRRFAGDPPCLDLVMLGLGPDAHTASIFPGSAAAGAREQIVLAYDVDAAHGRRMTLTAPVLSAAREVHFLVAGADKADAVHAVLEGPEDPERYPGQLVRAARMVWLLDEAAAGRLKRA